MYAYKIRRDEDYVVRPARAGTQRRGPGEADENTMSVASPARILQERLAAELASSSIAVRATGLSTRARAATIIIAALLCWAPFVATALIIAG